MKTEVVKTKDISGKDIELTVKFPNTKVIQNGMSIYSLEISKCIRDRNKGNNTYLLRQEVDKFLKDGGIWSDEDQKEFTDKQKEIRDLEVKVRRGGIKLSEAKKLCLEINKLRTNLITLYVKRQSFDSNTIEALAENERFDYFVSECVFDSNNKYFSDLEDYKNRSTEVAAQAAASTLAKMIYGLPEDLQQNYFEIQWLKKAKFMNEKGQLINKEGKFVDKDGRLIDEFGRYIAENGDFVDVYGNKVDPNGQINFEESLYIDDDTGNEVKLVE